MAVLAQLLSLIGYKSEQEQIAYVKMMAYRDFFSKPSLLSESKEEHQQILASKIENALKIWHKTGLKEAYAWHRNNIITDFEAEKLLATPFESLEEGYSWLSNIADICFLRREFYAEGIGKEIEKAGLNTKLWDNQDKIKLIDVQQSPASISAKVYQCARDLQLMSEHKPLNNFNTENIVLFSSLEHYAVERINMIKQFSGNIYCLTGPRGLFNFEKSVAPILAEWFGSPEKESLIQNVLDKHLESHDCLQWTMNLSDLKREILAALNQEKWPSALQSYYYMNKEVYDTAANNAAREQLDCAGGPWPVAMDMLIYNFKKLSMNNLSKINFVPVVALGKNNKLAGVDDMVEAWYSQYGEKILDAGSNPLFIACNQIHAIPFILNNLKNNIQYVNNLEKQEITFKLNNFIKLEDKIKITNPCYVVGPAANELNLQFAFDALAKVLFALRFKIKKLIIEYELLNDDDVTENSPALYAKRMIRYNNFVDHLQLANSSIDLAYTYQLNNDFIKIGGLFNFAINVLKSLSDKRMGVVINLLDECTYVNICRFVIHSLRRQHFPLKAIGVDQVKLANLKNKEELRGIRINLINEFKQLKDSQAINKLYTLGYLNMRKFFISIIKQSIAVLGKINSKLTFCYLGSYARMQATPYSDLESFILVEHADRLTIKYSQELTKLILLNIINLGETVLTSLGIVVYNHKGKEISLVGQLFDIFTPQGFSFDRNIAAGFKTPLGKKQQGIVAYRLIDTPKNMVKKLVSQKGCHLDSLLPQMLHESRGIVGDKQLFLEFQRELQKNDSFNIASYSFLLFKQDLQRYGAYLKDLPKQLRIEHKNYFFRPINVLLDDVCLHLGLTRNCKSQIKIRRLYALGYITIAQKRLLETNLWFMLYLRLQQHFMFKEQKTYLSRHDELFQNLVLQQNNLLYMYDHFEEIIRNTEKISLLNEASIADSYNQTDISDRQYSISQLFFSKLNKKSQNSHHEEQKRLQNNPVIVG